MPKIPDPENTAAVEQIMRFTVWTVDSDNDEPAAAQLPHDSPESSSPTAHGHAQPPASEWVARSLHALIDQHYPGLNDIDCCTPPYPQDPPTIVADMAGEDGVATILAMTPDVGSDSDSDGELEHAALTLLRSDSMCGSRWEDAFQHCHGDIDHCQTELSPFPVHVID